MIPDTFLPVVNRDYPLWIESHMLECTYKEALSRTNTHEFFSSRSRRARLSIADGHLFHSKQEFALLDCKLSSSAAQEEVTTSLQVDKAHSANIAASMAPRQREDSIPQAFDTSNLQETVYSVHKFMHDATALLDEVIQLC